MAVYITFEWENWLKEAGGNARTAAAAAASSLTAIRFGTPVSSAYRLTLLSFFLSFFFHVCSVFVLFIFPPSFLSFLNGLTIFFLWNESDKRERRAINRWRRCGISYLLTVPTDHLAIDKVVAIALYWLLSISTSQTCVRDVFASRLILLRLFFSPSKARRNRLINKQGSHSLSHPSRWVKTRFFYGLTAKVLFRFFYWTPVHRLLPPTVSYLKSTSSLIAARAKPISKWLRPWPCTDRQRRYFYDFLVVVIVFRWIAEYFFSSPRRLFNAERKMKAKRRRRRRGMFLGSPSSSRCVWLRVRPSVGRWVDGVSLWALRWWMESEWRRVWFVACNTDKKRRENDGHTFITFLRLLTTLSRVCYFSSLFIRSSFRQDDQKKKKLDVEHNKRKGKSRCAICVGK